MRGDNDIFEATNPATFQILGLELKPFSLGHYFVLRRLGCSFVSDQNEQLTREDLLLAVLVCSMDPDRFEKWVVSGKLSFFQKVGAWFLFITGRIKRSEFAFALVGQQWEYEVARWGRKVGEVDLDAKATIFQAYLKESARAPKFWIEREDGSASGSHWAHSVLVTLTGQLGFTENRVKSMPLREALLHFFKLAESNGTVKLMTAEELEMMEVTDG